MLSRNPADREDAYRYLLEEVGVSELVADWDSLGRLKGALLKAAERLEDGAHDEARAIVAVIFRVCSEVEGTLIGEEFQFQHDHSGAHTDVRRAFVLEEARRSGTVSLDSADDVTWCQYIASQWGLHTNQGGETNENVIDITAEIQERNNPTLKGAA